eukprot:9313625-Alexandrium_andersonii.AAC.1
MEDELAKLRAMDATMAATKTVLGKPKRSRLKSDSQQRLRVGDLLRSPSAGDGALVEAPAQSSSSSSALAAWASS